MVESALLDLQRRIREFPPVLLLVLSLKWSNPRIERRQVQANRKD